MNEFKHLGKMIEIPAAWSCRLSKKQGTDEDIQLTSKGITQPFEVFLGQFEKSWFQRSYHINL